jgi:glycosyltransferase involved in cell wall biosynthesis
MVEQLRASGAVVHTSPMRRSVGPWDASHGLKLRRELKSIGPLDILHSHSSKAGALARVFGRRRGTAQFYSPHGFYTMTGEAPAYVGAVERVLSRITDRIIAVSKFERDHALALGIEPERVVVVANGLEPSTPLSRAKARALLGLEPNAFVVGFVGRLEPQKNPVDAVLALGLAQHANAELAIIGSGAMDAEVELAASKMTGRVHLLGTREAKPLFAAFDALLCTSRYEGMPVAFLESLNAGVPIISYPVGGSDELIDEGLTGFVCEPYPAAAAAAISRLQRMSSSSREDMRSACLAMAARHSDEVMGAETLAVYRSLVTR